jgi:hypothetical protein
MITAPNKYLGISADKLPYIATELEQKNATLTAENVRLQKELEAEHALAEALGHELEQVKADNAKLRDELAKWERLTAGIDLPEYPVTQFEPKDLERENEKLRELVADMWEYIHIGTAQDGQSLHDRTRELGIEVRQ